MLVHVDRLIAYANPATAAALGVASVAELIGRSIVEFATPLTRAKISARMAASDGGVVDLPGNTTVSEQSFVRVDDGREVHAEVRSIAYTYEGRVATLSTARDITWRTETEHAARLAARAHAEVVAERERLEQQLRQAQKMEAIGRLAGGVAHDFNNLLTVILSYAELDFDALAPDDPIRENFIEIQKAALRAVSLTRQLLAFGRQQLLQPRPVDLDHTLRGIASMLRRVLGEDIELSLVTGCAAREVFADPGQIEQVVMNLVVNARDAMPTGGTLTLTTQLVELPDGPPSDPFAAEAGSFARLTVRDTGVGMDEATRARIFEPFFTTKALGHGTGLGLATVFGIVHQSGGRVTVASEPGRGARFDVDLPLATRPAGGPSETVSTTRITAGTETVLVVEDEDAVRVLLGRLLRRNGYHVLDARGGDEAFRIATAYTGPIALLLTDVVMPRISGPEVAKRLVADRPGLKILYMSGYTDDTTVRHGVRQAGVAFVQKPITSDVLLQKVRDVLDTENAGLVIAE